MRVEINLASRKYEDVQQFFFRWRTTLVALAGLTALLAALAAWSHVRLEKSGREIKALEQKVATLQKQRDDLIAIDNRPENRAVTEQKTFWNAEIAKRNLSWTQLFNDLQKIMPNRAFLNSVQPELTRDNRLKLKIVIAGEKQGDARELQKRMEDSDRFHAPQIKAEERHKGEKNGPPLWKFEIETDYTPASAASQPRTPEDRRGQSTRSKTEPSEIKEAV